MAKIFNRLFQICIYHAAEKYKIPKFVTPVAAGGVFRLLHTQLGRLAH